MFQDNTVGRKWTHIKIIKSHNVVFKVNRAKHYWGTKICRLSLKKGAYLIKAFRAPILIKMFDIFSFFLIKGGKVGGANTLRKNAR